MWIRLKSVGETEHAHWRLWFDLALALLPQLSMSCYPSPCQAPTPTHQMSHNPVGLYDVWQWSDDIQIFQGWSSAWSQDIWTFSVTKHNIVWMSLDKTFSKCHVIPPLKLHDIWNLMGSLAIEYCWHPQFSMSCDRCSEMRHEPTQTRVSGHFKLDLRWPDTLYFLVSGLTWNGQTPTENATQSLDECGHFTWE